MASGLVFKGAYCACAWNLACYTQYTVHMLRRAHVDVATGGWLVITTGYAGAH